MKDLILKTEKINWRELIPYQPDDLKKTTPELMKKLKTSLLNNGLASPLNIWEKNKKRYVIDAHHRLRAMHELEAEGNKLPDKLTANFLNIQNDKQAKKLILLFNSHYATIEKKGLRLFLNDMNIAELKLEFEPFKLNYGMQYDEDIVEDEPPAVPDRSQSKTGDLYELGPHRVICGDSTDEKVFERLMQGEKADMVFTSPPYNTGGFDMNQGGKKKKYVKGIYAGGNDNKTEKEYLEFNKKVLNNISNFITERGNICYNLSYNQKSTQSYIKIINNAIEDRLKLHETIIWKKSAAIPQRARLTRHVEFIFVLSLDKGKNPFTNQKFECPEYNYWSIPNTGQQGEINNACFPVALPSRGINLFCTEGGCTLDAFTGSGSTLIACEQADRIFRGIEIDPHYIDVIVQRWVNFTGKTKIKKNGKEIEWKKTE